MKMRSVAGGVARGGAPDKPGNSIPSRRRPSLQERAMPVNFLLPDHPIAS